MCAATAAAANAEFMYDQLIPSCPLIGRALKVDAKKMG
jgi:hypothetical protein